MSARTSTDRSGAGGSAPGRLTFAFGLAIVLLDVAAVYVAVARTLADPIAYAIAGAAAAAIGGSFLQAARVHLFGDGAAPGEKSTATRVAEVIVSITVLTALTALAYAIGLVLALVAALGGPDPETADGELLRERLLEWVGRNRAFMRSNGEGEFPVAP